MSPSTKQPRKDLNRYPKGLNRKKVEALIAHYENQSDDRAIAEAEAAHRGTAFRMMAIPVELVPQVKRLLAKRAG
jgi:hypothetical protein